MLVEYACEDHVATLTLNRPEKLNAFSDELVELRWLSAVTGWCDCRKAIEAWWTELPFSAPPPPFPLPEVGSRPPISR